jgi:iron complex outermembrane recepter protein
MNRRPIRTVGGVALLGMSEWLLSQAVFADTAADTTASVSKDAASEPLQEVVVTGIRASLTKSLEEKQDASVVLDSINAVELGRFPDADVADSLRHIPGVSILRTTGGDGMYVAVRGLGQNYNIVTLNNRILATDDDGRALAFDVLPSDVISGADVLKSSQASALEGSIGGTVNMRTASPFDNPGLHGAARVEENYNDMSYFKGTKGSAFVSDTNSGGTMGFLLGVVVSDLKTRSDALNYNTYDGNLPGTWPPPTADGTANPNGVPVVAECCISFGSVIDDKKRQALSGTLEWRPSGTLRFALDGLYTKLNDPQVAYNQSYYPDFNYDQNKQPEWSNVTVKNGFINSFTANTFTPEIVNQTVDRKVTTSLIGLNGSWEVSSRFTVDGDLYRSTANRPEGGQDAFVTAGLESPTPYNQNTISWTNNWGHLPSISVTLPNGEDYAQALASGQLNNNYWTAHYTGLSGNSIHDKVTGATLDGTLKFDSGVFTKLRFGLAETQREKSRDDYDNDWTGGSSQYDWYTTPDGANPITFGSLGANVVSITNFPNYMQGAGGKFPTTVAVFNVPNLLAALASLNGQPNLYPNALAPTYDFALSLPQFNAVNSYDVKETTTAGYFEATFAGGNWSGNAGLRLVHTSTTASTAINEIESVTIANTSNPTDPASVVYSDPVATSSKSSYTEPLPSLNLLYRFKPDLQMRFAASETITRPELNQLAPTRTDNSLNRVYEVDYSGSPDLKPIRSYGADLTLEWYYQPQSAFTVAVFGKYIKDFITTKYDDNVDLGVKGYFNGSTTPVDVLYTVSAPVNGDKAYVDGVEVAITHLMPSGFGVHAQYTHVWTRAWVDGAFVGELEQISPTSASVGLLYEKNKISMNVEWDYDGPSISQTFTEIQGLSAYQTSYNWVTAQASYEFLPGFKIYAEGKNLTNSIARTFLGNGQEEVYSNGNTNGGTSSAVGQGYAAFGRTYTLGVSYQF